MRAKRAKVPAEVAAEVKTAMPDAARSPTGRRGQRRIGA